MKTVIRLMAVAVALLAAQVATAQAPAGSTGQCKDGTYSTAASKQGACRGHQGVKEWYAAEAPAGTKAPATVATPAPGPVAAPSAASPKVATPTPAPAAAAPSTKASPSAKAAAMPQAAGGGP